MPDFRRPVEFSSWCSIGIGLAISAAIGLTAASRMGSIQHAVERQREQDTCDIGMKGTKRYERTAIVSTKKMTTRGDTNPNAVLKWINDNCIKMELTDTKEAKQVIDKVRPLLIFCFMCRFTYYGSILPFLFFSPIYLVYQTSSH